MACGIFFKRILLFISVAEHKEQKLVEISANTTVCSDPEKGFLHLLCKNKIPCLHYLPELSKYVMEENL